MLLAVDGAVADRLSEHAVESAGARVENSGAIFADGGSILLTAAAASSVVDTVVNMDGYLQARSFPQVDGEIVLLGDGVVQVAGTLDASGTDAGETGGTVWVLGDRIALLDDADINASGSAGGGTILVGGDYQGGGDLARAARTYVAPSATLSADAGVAGHGGHVVVWADEVTRYYGGISVRGGPAAGDGGQVEVSSEDHLVYRGAVDLAAANGAGGALLLDPRNGTVDNVGGDALTDADSFSDTPSADVSLLAADIVAALDGGNVTLQFNNDLTINAAIDASGNAGAGNLTAQAARSIALNANVTL